MLANQAPWKLSLPMLVALLIAPPLVVLGIGLVRARAVFGMLPGGLARRPDDWRGLSLERKTQTRLPALFSVLWPDNANWAARRLTLRQSLERYVFLDGAIWQCDASGCSTCARTKAALSHGDENHTLDRLKSEATQWLRDWQTESLRQRPRPNATKFKGAKSADASSLRSSTAKIVAAIVMTGSALCGGQRASAQAVATFDERAQTDAASVELSDLQQQTLLAEANKCYNTALEKFKATRPRRNKDLRMRRTSISCWLAAALLTVACISIWAMRISRVARRARHCQLSSLFANRTDDA